MKENYTIQSDQLTVEVSSYGAELQSIRSKDGTEFLWQGDPKYWTDRSPNLFPYVARLWEGNYMLDGVRYSMPIHGFAPYRTFAVTERQQEALCMQLESDQETLRMYPRRFAFRVLFSVKTNTLTVRYEIENRDEKILYCGLGGHPGLRVPMQKNASFEDYRLRFSEAEEPKQIRFTKQCFRDGTDSPFPLDNGTDLHLKHTLFDQDAIVLKGIGHTAALLDRKGTERVRVSFPDMNYLGIWHMPHTDAPYVCLEPWCSLPSMQDQTAVFEEQTDLLRVQPGETIVRTFSITVRTALDK